MGYFGRLEVEKGVSLLIESLQGSSWRPLFVGAGSLTEEVRRRLPRATVIPWVKQTEAFALMRQCKAVVLPSIWQETWGLVVPEALSQGTPVAVSALAGSSELVQRYGGGVVFQPEAPAAVRSAIDLLLCDEGRRKAFAFEASQVEQRAGLSMKAHALRLASAIEDLWQIEVLSRETAPA